MSKEIFTFYNNSIKKQYYYGMAYMQYFLSNI